MNWLETLTALTQAPGVSGNEIAAARAAERLFAPLCETEIDRNQSLIATLKAPFSGKAPTIQLDAHLDEIGLIITRIDDRGFLSFGTVGGIIPRHLPSSEVIVHGREDVYGVVTSVPPHLGGMGANAKPAEDCLIDVGFTKEELEGKIALGDSVTFVGDTARLAGDRIISKALDDRSCCAILLRTAELLKETPADAKVVFTCTVGEETTSRGGSTSAFTVEPDGALVLDVTFAREPGSPETEDCRLGSGPAIGIAPVIDREIFAMLKDTAAENSLPYTVEVMPGRTGTHADAIGMCRGGCRVGMISLPLRYMHTPGEVCDEKDLEACAQLAAAAVRKMAVMLRKEENQQ